MKPQVVIFTKSRDFHAFAVGAGLQNFGVDAVLISGHQFPTKLCLSFEISDSYLERFSIESMAGRDNLNPISVWYRRRSEPSIDNFVNLDLSPQDMSFAHRESHAGFSGLLGALGEQAVWVNPYGASSLAEHKPLQLSLAKKVGFSIPRSIVSNNPEDIKRFLSTGRRYIYKPFKAGYWNDTELGFLRLPTSEVNLAILPSDEYLRLTPGIYQEKIDKKYEVRANIFGRYCIAVRINTQQGSTASIDWRTANHKSLSLSLIELPSNIYKSCLAIMAELGIVFGCFDFIVSENGSYIFLEVNAAGQFLWIEDVLPEARLLSAMCGFLYSGNPNFDGKWEGAGLELKEVEQSEVYLRRIHEDADGIVSGNGRERKKPLP